MRQRGEDLSTRTARGRGRLGACVHLKTEPFFWFCPASLARSSIVCRMRSCARALAMRNEARGHRLAWWLTAPRATYIKRSFYLIPCLSYNQ